MLRPSRLCLVSTTTSKKNVRFITAWCYCGKNVFSKLNKDNEYDS
ncbi:L-aspartate oxidase [Raoultella planticola]|nr:L-aspartate oxidase [Raoultella planticola]RNN93627.1 L-aspartate oxidase [Raoultella planticola]